MKKITAKILSVILAFIILVDLVFVGCSSSKKTVSNAIMDGYVGQETDNIKTDNYGVFDEAVSCTVNITVNDRKIVKTGRLSVQTKEFDNFIKILETETEKLNGYYENGEISGNSYDYNRCRNAYFTIKIPADKLDEFIEFIENESNVTNKTISAEDITDDYIDVSSKITALETEMKALLSILEKAETVSDTIEIQERISIVSADLDSYKSKLKAYDKMVSFSSVDISVYEVERVTPNDNGRFFSEIKTKLSDNLYNIKEGFLSFVIWFISSLPYILIIAIILIIFIIIIKKIIKKSKKKQ